MKGSLSFVEAQSRLPRASGRGATKSAVVFARGGDKVPRDCKHVARVKADQSEFSALFEAADKYAKVRGSDRWAEIQPGYMAFHFASYIACFNFCTYLARRGLQLMTTEQRSRQSRRLNRKPSAWWRARNFILARSRSSSSRSSSLSCSESCATLVSSGSSSARCRRARWWRRNSPWEGVGTEAVRSIGHGVRYSGTRNNPREV